MAEVMTYSPDVFQELPTFQAAQESLQELESQITPLAELVSEHGGDAHVGIALLHRHFSLHADEVLVEEVMPKKRLSIGRPRTNGSCAMTPHLFRAIRHEGHYAWYPLEFVRIAPSTRGSADSYAWFKAQSELLDALATALESAGALDVFGLSLSHG